MPRPSPSDRLPKIVKGPTQKSSEALSHPSMKRSRAAYPSSRSAVAQSATAWARRRAVCSWSTPASPASRSSIRRTDPVIDPMSSDPNTTRTGTPGPTAARSEASVTETADNPATSIVVRPRQSVTTERVRSGSRCPTHMPSRAPMTTVTTLMTVPSPGKPTFTGPPYEAAREPVVRAAGGVPGGPFGGLESEVNGTA